MDATADAGGYRPMGPLVESTVQPLAAELSSDYLLLVTDPRGARTALDTADRLVLLDARATVWQVVERLAIGSIFMAWMAAATAADADADFPIRGWWLITFPFVAIVVVSAVCSRRVGMSLSGRERLLDGLAWAALAVAGLSWALAEPKTRGAVLVVVAFAVVFALIPVVRWQRATHRAKGVEGWPPGAQAFALLSLLGRAGAVAPGRLIGLAGLSSDGGDRWLLRLRAEHSVFGGRRRHWVLGDERARITPLGQERLHRMRAELERVAAEAPAD